MTDIVGKLWGFCHTLRHDGIDYGDYIEQLTYLLFLKMIEEKGAEIPPEYSWAVLREKSGTELTDHYMTTLRKLGVSCPLSNISCEIQEPDNPNTVPSEESQ
jgi:type I restriction enzyme M protein